MTKMNTRVSIKTLVLRILSVASMSITKLKKHIQHYKTKLVKILKMSIYSIKKTS